MRVRALTGARLTENTASRARHPMNPQIVYRVATRAGDVASTEALARYLLAQGMNFTVFDDTLHVYSPLPDRLDGVERCLTGLGLGFEAVRYQAHTRIRLGQGRGVPCRPPATPEPGLRRCRGDEA